jgi:urease accessory protein
LHPTNFAEEIAPFNPEIGAYQHYHDLEEAKKG